MTDLRRLQILKWNIQAFDPLRFEFKEVLVISDFEFQISFLFHPTPALEKLGLKLDMLRRPQNSTIVALQHIASKVQQMLNKQGQPTMLSSFT
jgi:hypothetical protein